jgi:hypothetical protein
MSRSVAAVAAGLVLATASLAVPRVRHYAGFPADGPNPRYDTPLPAAAIRAAGRSLPDDVTYLLSAPGADPLTAGNLKAAAQLFFAPALPAQAPAQAQWTVTYDVRARSFSLHRRK